MKLGAKPAEVGLHKEGDGERSEVWGPSIHQPQRDAWSVLVPLLPEDIAGAEAARDE